MYAPSTANNNKKPKDDIDSLINYVIKQRNSYTHNDDISIINLFDVLVIFGLLKGTCVFSFDTTTTPSSYGMSSLDAAMVSIYEFD